MLSEITEHIDEGVPHLPRGLQGATVPAIRKERPATIQELVHVPSDADGDAAYPRRERSLVRRFHEQMHVIRLHGEVNDTKPTGGAARRATDGQA